MRAATPISLSALLLFAATAARADVAPDPVVTTGVGVIALGVLALVIFGMFAAIRYLRRARAKDGAPR